MMTPATDQKRQELLAFIERVLKPEPAIQAVIGIGSIATGHMRPDSDIDAVVFFDPLDWYIIPAEFIWRPSDGTFHSIFTPDEQAKEEGIELDCLRLDLKRWADPAFEWPEGRRAEMGSGWLAFDRHDRVAPLIAQRTTYPDQLRQERLDEAITWLDQHLNGGQPERIWATLGPLIAHDRLQAAYHYLVRALFALNRRWLPWRNRQLDHLLGLAWLPENFADRILLAANSPGLDKEAYEARVQALRPLFEDLLEQVVADGLYSAAPIDQAFIRAHEEPGYEWNMADWKAENLARMLAIVSQN